MMIVATLVAPAHTSLESSSNASVTDSLLAACCEAAAAAGATPAGARVLEPGMAHDLMFDHAHALDVRAQLEPLCHAAGLDVIVQDADQRCKRLLVADMDSTMITIECIDELADYIGRKAEVAEITDAAMRGDLDFATALDARVSLLAGLPLATLQRCYDERVAFTPGAATLVQTMRAHGAPAVLVSGGFTFFTAKVAASLGFARDVANVLDVDAELRLTGRVCQPIVTAAVKRETLLAEALARGLSMADCMTVGDGANDIPMIETAGLGIAFHARPVTRAAADGSIVFGDLTALLYAQGYLRAAWVSA